MKKKGILDEAARVGLRNFFTTFGLEEAPHLRIESGEHLMHVSSDVIREMCGKPVVEYVLDAMNGGFLDDGEYYLRKNPDLQAARGGRASMDFIFIRTEKQGWPLQSQFEHICQQKTGLRVPLHEGEA